MKLNTLTALLLITLAAPTFTQAAQIAPDFALPSAEGEVSLPTQHGRVVYLDFWASWCAPCRHSFPWMDEMQAKYGPQGLTVIAVNLDKDEGKIKEFLAATQPHFTIAYDPEGKVAESYQVTGMPSSYLIGRDGTLQQSHVGFRDKDKVALERQIVELLAEPQGGPQ